MLLLPFVLLMACGDDPDNPDNNTKKDAAVADAAQPDSGAAKDNGQVDMAPSMDMPKPDLKITPDKAKPDMPPASGCPSGGKKLSPSGSGTCKAPYKVDLSGTKVGDVVYVEVPGTVGADEKQFYYPSYSGCNPKSTARDVIFALTLPSTGVSGVWVHADAVAGVDPIATMLEDQSCGQPANACANKNGVGKEECLLAKKGGTGYFGSKPYAVVSEVVTSKKPLTVRFRMVP